MCSSCSMPFSTSATRVSRGVTLIRISSDKSCLPCGACLREQSEFAQQPGGLEHGQAHDCGMAAGKMGDETTGATLDAVGAGLAHGFAGGDVAGDGGIVEFGETHLRFAGGVFLAVGADQPDGGDHAMRAVGL